MAVTLSGINYSLCTPLDKKMEKKKIKIFKKHLKIMKVVTNSKSTELLCFPAVRKRGMERKVPCGTQGQFCTPSSSLNQESED